MNSKLFRIILLTTLVFIFFIPEEASAAGPGLRYSRWRGNIYTLSAKNGPGVKAACRLRKESHAAGFIIKRKFHSLHTLRAQLRKLMKGKKRKRRKKIITELRGSLLAVLIRYRRNKTIKPLRQSCRKLEKNLPGSLSPSKNETPGKKGDINLDGGKTSPLIPPVTPAGPVYLPAPSLPEKLAWEQQMLEFGTKHCELLKNGTSFDPKLLTTYYDAQWVFFQMADYTGDSFWSGCAEAAEKVYRDQYVLANDGGVPGYWNFSHGVLHDFLRTGDDTSFNAVEKLSRNAAYAADTTPLDSTRHVDYSREVAYTMMSYINAEFAGFPRRNRLDALRDQAMGHLEQWFLSRTAPYIRPFMVALTSQALITYDEYIGDPRILPAIEMAMNDLWESTWLADAECFQYTDRDHSTGGTEPAPDLNLLIAPVYGWLYYRTGKEVYRERGDRIFAGGVNQAYLVNGKQFNQNYRWSFKYLKWREGKPY